LAQINRLTAAHCAYGLLVGIAVDGSHRECTGRDQYELHPDAIGEAWGEPRALLLRGDGQAIQGDGYDKQRTCSRQSHA